MTTINKPPILVYLAYKFSRNPTENTKKARDMAILLMVRHPDWLVICPHYVVDALLDGTIDWTSMKEKDFSEWRRTQAGLMAAGIMSRCDIVVFGCKPTYDESSGVTWEHIITKLLNMSWRRDNPIKIMTYQEAMNITCEECYYNQNGCRCEELVGASCIPTLRTGSK